MSDDAAQSTKTGTVEDRLRSIEDRLEIYNLIASHPPIVDSGDVALMKGMFTTDGILDRGAILGAVTVAALPDEPNSAMTDAITENALAHLTTLPFVRLEGERAVAVSYVAVTVKEPSGEEFSVPAHGSGRGHRLFRITANRWELENSPTGWRISRRTLILVDGDEAARRLMLSGLSNA